MFLLLAGERVLTGKPGGPARDGESIATSSLTPEEEPRARKAAGGGVVLAPPILLDSEKLSQKVLPFEFLMTCCLKLLDSPVDRSPIMSSSAVSSKGSCWVMFGEEGAVVVV